MKSKSKISSCRGHACGVKKYEQNDRHSFEQLGLIHEGFLEFIKSLALNPHVVEITRGNNILDLVFTSDPFSVLYCKVCAPFGSSDHLSINFQLYFSSIVLANNDLYSAYGYENANWDAINRDLNCTNWSNLYTDCTNSNDFRNSLANHVINLCYLYIPCSIRKCVIIIKDTTWVIHGNF